MAKAPVKKTAAKTTKPKKAAVSKTKANAIESEVDTAGDEAPVKKTRRKASPKVVEPQAVVTMHGDMKIIRDEGPDAPKAADAIASLADEVHGLGRIQITSAAHVGATTTLHAVLPGHPTPYDLFPGLILTIDALTNLVSFDHVEIGKVSSALIDDAAYGILTAMQPDNDNPANGIGRRGDWFERAVEVANDLAMNEAHADRAFT